MKPKIPFQYLLKSQCCSISIERQLNERFLANNKLIGIQNHTIIIDSIELDQKKKDSAESEDFRKKENCAEKNPVNFAEG